MQTLRQDPDLAKGLSTSRNGGRRHLCLRVEAAGRDTGSRRIAPTYSEMTFNAPPRSHATAQRSGEQRESGGAKHGSGLGGTRHGEQVGGGPQAGLGWCRRCGRWRRVKRPTPRAQTAAPLRCSRGGAESPIGPRVWRGLAARRGARMTSQNYPHGHHEGDRAFPLLPLYLLFEDQMCSAIMDARLIPPGKSDTCHACRAHLSVKTGRPSRKMDGRTRGAFAR